jgi:PAS domain S-box-containing protein
MLDKNHNKLSAAAAFQSTEPPAACLFCNHYTNIEQEYIRLAYREATLLSLIENTSELICSIDREYRVTTLNTNFSRALTSLLGVTVAPGFQLLPYIEEAPRRVWLHELDRAFQGEQFTEEHFIQRENTQHFYSVAYHPVKEGGEVIGVTCFSQDITARKIAEHSLKESERRYRSVVNNVKEVVFQTDAAGNWIFLNPSWTEVTGFSVEEALGMNYLDFIHPDDREKASRMMRSLPLQKKEFTSSEIRYLTKDGNFRHIQVCFRVYTDENNQITGSSGTLSDMTHRRTMEASLIQAKEEAEAASQAKTQFMSRMSHELRTPLNAILGFAQLLELADEPRLTDTQLDQVGEILNAGQHLLELVTDILDLSRMEIGKLSLSPVPVELGGVMKECLSALQPLAHKNEVTLAPFDRPVEALALVERVRMKQVLLNLLSNAVKYNVRGGSVFVRMERSGSYHRISVSDTGIGIPERYLPSLFEPFTRFHDQHSIEGTGFGLTITKQLVELMSGRIRVVSREGEGTVVIVDIPALEC